MARLGADCYGGWINIGSRVLYWILKDRRISYFYCLDYSVQTHSHFFLEVGGIHSHYYFIPFAILVYSVVSKVFFFLWYIAVPYTSRFSTVISFHLLFLLIHCYLSSLRFYLTRLSFFSKLLCPTHKKNKKKKTMATQSLSLLPWGFINLHP